MVQLKNFKKWIIDLIHILIVILAVIFCESAFASKKVVSVSGRFVSKTIKTFAPEARVILFDMNHRVIKDVFVDSIGNFKLLTEILPDTYDLKIGAPGYYLWSIKNDTIIELSTIHLEEDPSQFPFMGSGPVHQQITESLKLLQIIPRPPRFKKEIWHIYLKQQSIHSKNGYEQKNMQFLRQFEEALKESYGFKIIPESSKANAFIQLKPVRFPNGHISHVVVEVSYQSPPNGTTQQFGSSTRLSDYSFAKVIAKRFIEFLPREIPE